LCSTGCATCPSERRDYAHIVNDFCREIVRHAVELLQTYDRTAIPVGLEQVAFKPKGIIEAKLTMGVLDRALRHALLDAQGSPVLLVVADATPYLGTRRPRLDDEPELPFAAAPTTSGKRRRRRTPTNGSEANA
jgi:hypothetical protein